jgi:Zn-dependent protease with chaperone function
VIADDEAESASNAYLLSLVLLMAGAPLPILNLLASVIFYFGARRSSPFVRWHCMQTLLGQILLIPINSVFMWMTLGLLLGYRDLDDFYIGWGLVMLVLNGAEWVASIYAAVKVRRGADVRWWTIAPMVDALLGRRPWRESAAAPVAGVAVVVLSLIALTRVPWNEALRTEKLQGRLEARLDEVIEAALDSGNWKLRNSELDATLRTMTGRLCEANDLDCDSYRLHLVRDMEVNAAALPGGHIIINSGLVLASPDAQALTGVLAHELAHAQHGHVRRRLLREIGLSTLMGADAAQSSILFRQMVSLSYDRSMEAEADRTAVDWMIAAHVDPAPLANFMASVADGGSLPFAALIRSHPASEERALDILERIPEATTWTPVLSAEQWTKFRESVATLVTDAE